jgi:hypothetical protein
LIFPHEKVPVLPGIMIQRKFPSNLHLAWV